LIENGVYILVHTVRFWNNLHQIHSKPKYWRVK